MRGPEAALHDATRPNHPGCDYEGVVCREGTRNESAPSLSGGLAVRD